MPKTRIQLFTEAETRLPDVSSGTATSGSATTLLDTSDDSPLLVNDDAQSLKGVYVYINAGTSIGKERRVTTYTPGSQQLTTPTFTTLIDSTSVYEIHRLMRRFQKNDILNRVLANHVWYYAPHVPLTLAVNGDFEAATGTDNWTGTNATLAEQTTVVYNGVKSLSVTASAANGYAGSDTIRVNENESYLFQAWVSPVNASATPLIVIRDVTNAATITLSGVTSVSANDGRFWIRLYGSFETPSGCALISVRLQDATNLGQTYWDDVIVWPNNRNQGELPSWCDEEWRFEWVWIRSSDKADAATWYPVTDCRVYMSLNDVRNNLVRYTPDGVGRPLYVSGFRNYATITTDTATTNAPPEWVKRAFAAAMYSELADGSRAGNQKQFELMAAKAIKARNSYPKPRGQFNKITRGFWL